LALFLFGLQTFSSISQLIIARLISAVRGIFGAPERFPAMQKMARSSRPLGGSLITRNGMI
jgi:hypothetical protein